MKLRIRGDSLRFRLTQGELSRLVANETVSESVHFSPSAADILTYSLTVSETATRMSAHFQSGSILVSIPGPTVASWAKSGQVGIESTQPIGEGRSLRLNLEKDFQCLQPRPEENESDNFPNPRAV